ncbi:protein regulator of cytokinesis 1 [Echinococcus multilocularis]|uniref:Protein regulator of cytokinesis 1 n=1 Tax=Echinococcus multilocularis TaxID=6211 RepID=A0A068XW75_ECHMU|nr:protein regulator of cytokinesis 1 [Echinococcus multilocularis]
MYQSNFREAGGQALPTPVSAALVLFLPTACAIANDRNLCSVMDIDSICLQISNGLAQQVDDLMKIWIYAGYSKTEADQKIGILLKSLKASFDAFIKSENELLKELNSKIESQRQIVAEFCSLLCFPPYFPPHGLTTCQLLQDLTDKVSELEQEKLHRKEEFQRLCREIITSSLQLGHSSDVIKRKLTKAVDVPSNEDIAGLKLILDENNATLGPLAAQLNALQADIQRIAAEIAYVPKTEREKSLLHLESNGREVTSDQILNGQEEVFNVDEEIRRTAERLKGALPNETDLEELKTMRLSLVKEKARLMGTCEELKAYLESMWKRLQKPVEECEVFLKNCEAFTPHSLQLLQTEADACRKERLQTIATYLPNVKAELLDLARTCCLENQESSNLAKIEAKERQDGGVELLDYLEHRIEELKFVYQQHRRVYEAIAAFQTSFNALQQVERRLKDPSILSNRGGILLKTEKEKKKLLKEVEKSEKETLAAIGEYEAEKGQPFVLSNGKTFVQAVEEQRNAAAVSMRGGRASSAAGRRPFSAGHPASQLC